MIKLLKSNVSKTKPVATDIFLTFKDTEINKEQYKTLKNQLNQYSFDINPEYAVTSETEYNESLKTLLIGITITIPDRLLSQGIIMKILADNIKGFQKFYNKQKNNFKLIYSA